MFGTTAIANCRLVAESIKPLEPARKCFQLIGGVLVERTVGDVLPIVEHNRESVCCLASMALLATAHETYSVNVDHTLMALAFTCCRHPRDLPRLYHCCR